MSYLTDYEEMDRGYVAFGGNPKGGKITRKDTKDETSSICKSFITGIENLVDHKRRNRTLIEVVRTTLADSKLPTTFWVEAVNIACYVQNSVLVVKPHNKTLYEINHGRTPILSFMRSFRYSVAILNTIDHLGKFDGKADEVFFVGYSLNSKAFRVFNSRTRIVEKNLHIRFSESTPNVVGGGPDWLFDIDALTRTMNYEPIVAGTQSNSFVDLKSSHVDGSKPSCDDGKKVDKDPRKESECKDQEKEDNVNSTNNVNTVNSTVNATSTNKDNELPFDPNMHALEDVSIFNFSSDDEDDGIVSNMNNLNTTIQVSPIPTTRIHKDHPLDQVIRDLQSATQTRKMLKNLEEQGLLVLFNKEQTIKTIKNDCLLAFYHMKNLKRYLKGQPKLALWYPKDSLIDLVSYTDSDYARSSLDRKSTTGVYQFLRRRLISWQCKQITVVANSITEAEYFWSTVMAKTINGEALIHARVDGKEVVITESSVRRALQLADEEGIDCLPNSTIFEQLALMG
nr:hypothetical protein [Tanacetum cinerariifolium]